ncbi:MAG TPA: GNAT family N-acetyltransferase [Flavitalea sp.]|nr:GNAT family N-acetyltransferase [Flavitalea sp.]
MDIKHKQTGNKGMFFIEEGDSTVAEMVYSLPSADKMIIEHTEVDDSLQGKNVGLQLLNATVAFARKENIKIIPLCSFAKAMFEKKAELRDVLFDVSRRSV